MMYTKKMFLSFAALALVFSGCENSSTAKPTDSSTGSSTAKPTDSTEPKPTDGSCLAASNATMHAETTAKTSADSPATSVKCSSGFQQNKTGLPTARCTKEGELKWAGDACIKTCAPAQNASMFAETTAVTDAEAPATTVQCLANYQRAKTGLLTAQCTDGALVWTGDACVPQVGSEVPELFIGCFSKSTYEMTDCKNAGANCQDNHTPKSCQSFCINDKEGYAYTEWALVDVESECYCDKKGDWWNTQPMLSQDECDCTDGNHAMDHNCVYRLDRTAEPVQE